MPGMPRPVADEREGLLAFVAQQRDLVATAAFGLTDEQARMTPTASALSVGGLVKHVTAIERSWMDTVLQRERLDGEAAEAAYGDDMVMTEDETLADLLADLQRAGEETEAIVAEIADLGRAVPVPDEPWFPKDVDAWSVRFVLLHLIEEHARHAGHADIVREHVDGATWYGLMAAREQLDLGPYVQPWTPGGAAA
jgi:uncharacterized damage-inducible protein DinB